MTFVCTDAIYVAGIIKLERASYILYTVNQLFLRIHVFFFAFLSSETFSRSSSTGKNYHDFIPL